MKYREYDRVVNKNGTSNKEKCMCWLCREGITKHQEEEEDEKVLVDIT